MSNTPTPVTPTRRSFLKTAALAGSAALLPLGLSARPARAATSGPTAGDIALLQFLAVAELVEADLWGQYAELATHNNGFHKALVTIDPALPQYARDTHDDELSHANFINAYLASVGATPINLDGFRTIAPPNVTGIDQSVKRLTNLTALTVDTSWFLRYRSRQNPDLGGTFAQIVDITNRTAVPISDTFTSEGMRAVAQTAAFHFCMIEQGGSSLYNNFTQKATHPDVLNIAASIGPTEVAHFFTFQTSLVGIKGLDTGDGLVFPDLYHMPQRAQESLPEPCEFLSKSLPLCSVIRPGTKANAGALAATLSLANSGLFTGQTDAFFNAAISLAQAADAAQRGV